jgi:hypothetical protein
MINEKILNEMLNELINVDFTNFQIEITRLYIQILLFIVRTNYVLVKRALSLSVYGSGLVNAYACIYIYTQCGDWLQ